MSGWTTEARLLLFWLAVLPLVGAPILVSWSTGRPVAFPVVVLLGLAWLAVLGALLAAYLWSLGRTRLGPPSLRRPEATRRGRQATVAATADLRPGDAPAASRWEAWALAGARSSAEPSPPEPHPWRRALRVAFLALLVSFAILVAMDLVLPSWILQAPALLQALVSSALGLVIVGRSSGLRRAADWARAAVLLVGLYLALGALIIVLGVGMAS